MTKKNSPFFVAALLLFFFLIPFHPLGITSLQEIIFHNNTPPLFLLKAWKEIFLLLLFAGTISISKKRQWIEWDRIDGLIIFFSFISFAVSLINYETILFSSLFYGIKYSIFPIWIFFIFRRIPLDISQQFQEKFTSILPIFSAIFIGIGILFFGIAQIYPNFFGILGYSLDPSFSSIFQPLSYCQKISFTEICRAQGSLSGPNQLGAYLILLLFLIISLLTVSKPKRKKTLFFLFLLGGILLFLTFSRSAWIGFLSAGIFFIIYTPYLSKEIKTILFLRGSIFLILSSISLFFLFPNLTQKIISRSASSSQHYQLSHEAGKKILQTPFGLGIGSAGAASKHSTPEGSVENGMITENWYLQIGIETGILGIIIWIGLIFSIIKKTAKENLSLAATFLGVSVIGLFLHSWESSAVAYTIWGLAGLTLPKSHHK